MTQRDRLAEQSGYQRLEAPIQVPLMSVAHRDGLPPLTNLPVRRIRSIVVIAIFSFGLGTMLIVWNSPAQKHFIVPGPLASHHAQILSGEGTDRCAACHSSTASSLFSWFCGSPSSGAACEASQTELCLTCHAQTLGSQFATSPHGVDPRTTIALTSKRREKIQLAGFVPPRTSGRDDLACSICHREHQGAENDLTSMTDRQCQTCHVQSHQSFETDHPDFQLMPMAQRPVISFDHASHSNKHFTGKQRSFDCRACHVGDPERNVMQLANFDSMCADCHGETLRDNGQQGLVLFALPMLDVRAIEAQGMSVGQWPAAATGDFDGVIPPLMRALLLGDEKSHEVLSRLGANFQFSDVDSRNGSQVQDAVQLAWGIKRLIFELGRDGSNAIEQRLSVVTGSAISETEPMRKLARALPPELISEAGERWLPNLRDEISQLLEGRRVDLLSDNQRRGNERVQDDATRNAVSNSIPGIIGTPSIQGPAKSPAPSSQTAGTENQATGVLSSRNASGAGAFTIGPRIVDVYDSQAAAKPTLRSPPVLTPQTPSPGPTTKDRTSVLLAENPLTALRGKRIPQTGSLGNESVRQENKEGSFDNLDTERATNASPERPIANQSSNVPATEPFTSSQDSSQDRYPLSPARGTFGWARDDQLFKVAYFLTGHADPTIAALHESVASATKSSDSDFANQILESITGATGVGNCASCHDAASASSTTAAFAWRAEFRLGSNRPFTKFEHGPHLLQMQCTDCHRISAPKSGPMRLASFAITGKPDSTSKQNSLGYEFEPMTKLDCASCHRQGQATNSCTTCHNYHVTSSPSK